MEQVPLEEEQALITHKILPMSKRSKFVNKDAETPRMTCPHCQYSGRGWQKFPKISCCGKASAVLLTVLCMCWAPFCCKCSIRWDWMCPACHQCHRPRPEEIQP